MISHLLTLCSFPLKQFLQIQLCLSRDLHYNDWSFKHRTIWKQYYLYTPCHACDTKYSYFYFIFIMHPWGCVHYHLASDGVTCDCCPAKLFWMTSWPLSLPMIHSVSIVLYTPFSSLAYIYIYALRLETLGIPISNSWAEGAAQSWTTLRRCDGAWEFTNYLKGQSHHPHLTT